MEFSITCPIDGVIEVSLEDIHTVVLRDSDRADITFVCPHCGTQIQVTAIVPAFLLAAIQALADDADVLSEDGILVIDGDDLREEPHQRVAEKDDPRADAYCEYFRRQLEHIECVDDAVAEMDAGTPHAM